ncbi:MAG: phosphatase PAP2 family protein [Candidatus Magasanikbacteria bacterium]|nr:phosphatase PAP2 family protein [Candidatus Magasanikbacteria bacterium]
MNFNVRLFKRINALVGTSKWLDAFGRAGAELVVVAMLVWFVIVDLFAYLPSKRAVIIPILFLGTTWTAGWFLDLFIGLIVREPRPHMTHTESKLLFTPLMNWKSFPSDHGMSAWLIFFMAVIFHLPFAYGLGPLALWVSWGRVYAGVHYPFDIVGGMAVAGLVATGAYYVLVMLS